MRVYVRNLGGTPIILDLPEIVDGIISVDGIKFPQPQVPSSDPNTLDDYEEGSWTPALTFATPGNLSVAYTDQTGRYIKIGSLVQAWFSILTSTFTHTTASGNCIVTGLPFAVSSPMDFRSGSLAWQGITKPNYTDVVSYAAKDTTNVQFNISGSAQSLNSIAAVDMPTGGIVLFAGMVMYLAA